MKHWYYTLVIALVGSVAASFAALASSPSHIARPDRIERPHDRGLRKTGVAPRPNILPKVKAGADGTKQLYGMSLYDEDGGIYNYGGPLEYYSGPAEIHADGNHKKLAPSSDIKTQAGCYYDGKFISIFRDWSKSLVRYAFFDADTWTPVGMSTVSYTFTSPNVLPSDVTYDPTTKRLYGCFLEDTGQGFAIGSNFGYIDLTPELENWNEPVKVIKDLGVKMRGMASTADGVIYGIGDDLKLYTIDKITGALTEIGTIDFNVTPSTDLLGYDSADIDFETGQIYYFFMDVDWNSWVVRIDPTTAQSEVVADFSYDNGGNCDVFPAIYFKQQVKTTVVTPDKVTDLAVKPDGVALAANIEFTMPQSDTDGNALSDNIGWNVLIGENTIATGTSAAGEKVVTRVELPEGGLTSFMVFASVSGQNGSPQMKMAFIGNDVPVIPSRPMVGSNGTDVQIVWDAAVAQHADYDGNLAPVSYRVVRQPDGYVVAEATTELSATDHIDAEYKSRYTYGITPVSGEITGETVSARPFYAGSYFALPHDDDFDDELLFSQYPKIDENNDGNTWWIDATKGCAVYSSGTIDATDFLCVGPFKLTEGSKYNFSMLAGGHSVTETVAVYVGDDSKDVSSFSRELIAPVNVQPSVGDSQLSGSFVAEESGVFYFAIVALSGAGQQNLYIYDVHITEAKTNVPAAVTELKATPAEGGMTISCKLPTTTIGGGKAAVTSVIVRRDNTVVAEITEGVADGKTFSWTDTETATDGEHIYTVAAANAAGVGEDASCSAWWGADRPGRPVNMRVYEDLETPGLIHVVWEAPEFGANGGKYDASAVDWVVDWMSLGAGGTGLVHNGSKCSYDLQLSAEAYAEPNLIAFSVYGINSVGSSDRDGKLTRSGYFGPALSLPYRESFANFKYNGIWSGEALIDNGALFESYWDVTGGLNLEPKPYNDDCMDALTTTVDGGGYRLRSPRMAINGETNPTLVFYYFYNDLTKDFAVEIGVDDKPMQVLRNIDITPAGAGKWTRIEIPLSEYRNAKYFQFGFSGHALQACYEFIAIDNISVLDLKENDLTVMGVKSPDKADVGNEVVIEATIRNSGSKAVSGEAYKVRLLKNGKPVMENVGEDIAPDAEIVYWFFDPVSVADPETTVYNVEVEFAADENTADNIGNGAETRIVQNLLPAVTDLTGNAFAGVTLTWSEPAESETLPDPDIESFEFYESFTISDLGDWKLYDGDGYKTIIFQTSFGVLDYPNIGSPMAWQVIDPTEAGIFNTAWYPRSGTKMLVSFQSRDDNGRDVNCNDWLISPELFGEAQTISFYACTAMSSYAPEIIDVLYSTTGTEIDDFIPLAQDVEVPYNAIDWTEMSFDLPEGARHFAIVHKSADMFALMIDDIRYIPAGRSMIQLDLQGYNVYRDGEKLNEQPVSETTFVDRSVEQGKEYSYHVSVVWDKGESPLSNEFKVVASSALDSVNVDADICISALHGAIRVEGAAGRNIEVYTTTGIRIASVVASTDIARIEVAPGFYIVNAGGKTAKILVGAR